MQGTETMIMLIIILLFIAPIVIGYWIIFQKAGHPGWAAIVPIYNFWVITQIIKKPGYWVLLMMIPYAGSIWHIWSTNLLVKKFGKSEGFTVGCIFLPFIFYPILAATGVYEDSPKMAPTDSRILDA
jgi:hypothetical protein